MVLSRAATPAWRREKGRVLISEITKTSERGARRTGRGGRRRVEHPDGDVRMHHLTDGLMVLEAVECTHRWVVFHHTYSFALVLRTHGPDIRWRYNYRWYKVNSAHRMMAMQPGELHANEARTPPADLIVVQVAPALMQRVAESIGLGSAPLNIQHPHQESRDPHLLRALANFARDRCTSLFEPGGVCTCASFPDRNRANLVELVSVFAQHCAEGAHPLACADRGAAVVRKAEEYLVGNYQKPFDAQAVARHAGCDVYYLDHVFGAALGASPERYQQEILVARTAAVLTRRERRALTLEQVAREVGWPGAANGRSQARLLHKLIKRSFGLSPDALRPPPPLG
jgi:AraC-like DNA-binding protein